MAIADQSYKGAQRTSLNAAPHNASKFYNECMNDQHWYVFVCSSLITFFTGLLLVLSWRILSWLFCQRNAAAAAAAATGRGVGAGNSSTSAVHGNESSSAETAALVNGKKTGDARPDDAEVGWVTEAKDWAGELISGQTTTGRILVSSSSRSHSLDTPYVTP